MPHTVDVEIMQQSLLPVTSILSLQDLFHQAKSHTGAFAASAIKISKMVCLSTLFPLLFAQDATGLSGTIRSSMKGWRHARNSYLASGAGIYDS
jgi:hypothetical protein